MSALICNLPSEEVWVRKEYLTDHQSGHGEFVKGVWVSANPKMPDFKVSTRYYQVENSYERLAMGNEDEYFWKTAKERDSNPVKSSDLTNQEQKNDQTCG
jgi:hypothetical protein